MMRIRDLRGRHAIAAVWLAGVLDAAMPVAARDLGVLGETWRIAEADLLDRIEQQLVELERSGERARLDEEAKARARERLEAPEPVTKETDPLPDPQADAGAAVAENEEPAPENVETGSRAIERQAETILDANLTWSPPSAPSPRPPRASRITSRTATTPMTTRRTRKPAPGTARVPAPSDCPVPWMRTSSRKSWRRTDTGRQRAPAGTQEQGRIAQPSSWTRRHVFGPEIGLSGGADRR